MKRLMMWAGGLLLACVVIFAGLILLLPVVLDPNDYKGEITDIVYEKSGYRLEIPGDIELIVSPRLDVLFSLGQVRVQSGLDFPDTILASSEKANIELSLLPLLREKRLSIQGVKLHGVYCNLIRNKKGKGNWEMFVAADVPPASDNKEVASTPSPAPPAPSKTKAKKRPTLELGALSLSEITVRYDDQQSGKLFELKNFNVQTNNVQEGRPFHLQSQFTLLSSSANNSVLSVACTLESDVTLALAAKTLHLNSFSLLSQIKGFGIQETTVQLALDSSVNLAEQSVEMKNFSLSSGKLALQANAEVTDFRDPVFQGNLHIPEFSLRDFLEQNQLTQPVWKDDSALRQVGFSCRIEGDDKKIRVSDMQAVLDGTHATGNFSLIDFAQPAYDFKMHLDRFDLDRYSTVPVPPQSNVAPPKKKSHAVKSEVKSPQAAPAKAITLQPVFPVDMLRSLRFQLDLKADSMKVRGAEMSQVVLKAQGKDGLLQLQPFRAELYSGSLSAESSLDVRDKIPQLKMQSDLDHVQVGPLLTDMTGKEEVTGAAVFALQLATSGNSKEQLRRHANGTMNLALENGVVKKLHILQVIRQAKALYDGEQVVAAAADEPTGFAHISATGVIRDGILYNKDLKAGSDLMHVAGSGKVDFVHEYVDYLLDVTLTRGMDRNEKSGRTDYSKVKIPYKIQGKFSDLKQEADVVGLLKSQAQNLLMNELQKQLNKGDGDGEQGKEEDSTQQLLKKGLKSLFGN